MPWKFGQALNIGKRSQQQDRIGLFHNNGDNKHLLVVADGMGGIPKGDQAAQIVVDTAEQAFKTNKTGDPESLLEQICIQAHKQINRLDTGNSMAPGTTCALLFLDKRQACWAHIGDSRLYHFRDNQLIAQTRDHSLRQLMIDRGVIDQGSEEADATQNQLYKRLGGTQFPEPDIYSSSLQYNDMFLLCSDGFWQGVDSEGIPDFLEYHPIDQDGPEYLVNLALKNGGENCDNISVLLAQKGKKPVGFFREMLSLFKKI